MTVVTTADRAGAPVSILRGGTNASGDYEALWHRSLGHRRLCVAMPHAVYAQLGFPGAEDLANMFQYYCESNDEFRAQRPVALSRELHQGLLSFSRWLAIRRDRLRASM